MAGTGTSIRLLPAIICRSRPGSDFPDTGQLRTPVGAAEPLRAQLLERRDIAVPGVIHDNVETSKCGNRRLSDAFICHVKRDRANAVAVFFYQVIKSLRVACCGDESIAGFEYGLRNVSAQTARAAGD